MRAPQVSIVMPCYQQTAYLEEAVRSVLEQRGVEVELLVMDPGSTDGSQELVQRLQQKYGERLVPVFEPDRGQSEAVNRGMARARAGVLGWINSDDRLRAGALTRVVAALESHDDPAWLYGRAGIVDERGRRVLRTITHYKNWRGRRFSPAKLLTENFIPQVAVFWNRAMWRAGGGLDVTRHLDMDYDLWFRFARHAAPIVLREELGEHRVHREAKGSRLAGEQLAAARRTAGHYAVEFGGRGRAAMAVHRLLSARTRLAYRWLKP